MKTELHVTPYTKQKHWENPELLLPVHTESICVKLGNSVAYIFVNSDGVLGVNFFENNTKVMSHNDNEYDVIAED